jgi:hypothetical protein
MSRDHRHLGKPETAKSADGFKPARQAGLAAIAAIVLCQLAGLLFVVRIMPFLSNSGR